MAVAAIQDRGRSNAAAAASMRSRRSGGSPMQVGIFEVVVVCSMRLI